MVLPAPFGPRRPNTEPVGTASESDIEGEHTARIAAGQRVGDDRGRRIGG